MPRHSEWEKFTEWGKQYGDLVNVSIPGQNIVIVNSAHAAIEMMDKKSRIYSNRPRFPMGELVGWQGDLALVQYGPHHQKHRKVFRQIIGSNAEVRKFHHASEMEVQRFLNLLLDRPQDLDDLVKRVAGSLTLRITFGYETKPGTDPFLSTADLVMSQLTLAASPGIFLVNYIPILRHLPEWAPGAGFKQTAKEWGRNLREMLDRPHEYVQQEMAKGTAEPSVVFDLLQQSSRSEEEIEEIKWIAQDFYSGGSDTSVSTVYSFFKAMVLFPEVQAKAQAEIDAVIGNDRLPTIADRDNLPYVSALVVEAMRWHVVIPTGVPHKLAEDDVHNGYFIPKDTVIIPNVWGMTRSVEVYKNPEIFDPTRYIKTEHHEPELDPRNLIFGFGRRICPGRILADVSVFAQCAMVLAAFNIKPHMENGKPVMPDVVQEPGIISHPSHFKANIVPRSDKAVELIRGGVARGH